MSLQLILVRHGETDWNRDGRFQGRTDVPLNAAGVRQSEALAAELGRWQIDVVYSSPLQRARATAATIAATCGAALQVAPLLAEMAFGEWEGVPAAERRARWPDVDAAWAADPFGTTAPGGETFAEVCLRAHAFLQTLRGGTTETIVVCGHGMINGAIAHVLTGAPPRLQDNGALLVLPLQLEAQP